MNFGKKAVTLFGCLFLLGGCSFFGGSADNGSTANAAQPAVQAEAAPAAKAEAKTAAKTASKSKKSAKSGKLDAATVKADLDVAAQKLVGRASRTVVPSKAKPKVTKSGKRFVASYVSIDTGNVFTTVRPGSTAATPYTGLIEYNEQHMECTGATRAEALSASAQCKVVKNRRVTEMIRHDGKSWQF
ncbi:MAG: translation initiation factor 2 [Desulfovibrionaceae bacterium]|nr:translation initiation factor 2 [Desulfovibrionaceae bacterium]